MLLAQTQEGGGAFNSLPMIIMMAALIGLMWWSMRRSRKQQAAAATMRENLSVGQKVMTGSGMFGVIVRKEGDRVFLQGESGEVTEWLLPAINKIDPLTVPAAVEVEPEEFEVPEDASSLEPPTDDDNPQK